MMTDLLSSDMTDGVLQTKASENFTGLIRMRRVLHLQSFEKCLGDTLNLLA